MFPCFVSMIARGAPAMVVSCSGRNGRKADSMRAGAGVEMDVSTAARAHGFERAVDLVLEAAVADAEQQRARLGRAAEPAQGQRAVVTRLRRQQPSVLLQGVEELERGVVAVLAIGRDRLRPRLGRR